MLSDAIEFAVVDVETTGLFPGRHDRVLEIAVVRVALDGTVIREFATLINPERDVGPTHIHGIRSRDIMDAPTFRDIAGDLIPLLRGAVLVAHNAPFDLRFVRAEMNRAGYELPRLPALCTVRLAAEADQYLGSRRLEDLCSDFGVHMGAAHSARDDARAAAGLLTACLAQVEGDPMGTVQRLCDGVDIPALQEWPQLPPSGKTLGRQDAARRPDPSSGFIESLLGSLPEAATGCERTLEYQALLDRVLEDRRLTPDECDQLAALAAEIGLSREEATQANERYLESLVLAALEDRVITPAEAQDLDQVRRLLGISKPALAAMTDRLREAAGADVPPPDHGTVEGLSVCFTGTMLCQVRGTRATREMAQRLAADAGMVVKGNVSKKLDLLVLADPDSMSGKARRARELGIRLVAEPVFWRMVGEDIA